MMMPDTLAKIKAANGGSLPAVPKPAARKPMAVKKPIQQSSNVLSLALPPDAPSPLSLSAPVDPMTIMPQLQGRAFLNAPQQTAANRPGDQRLNSLALSQNMGTGKSRNAYMNAPEYNTLVDAARSTEPNAALEQGIKGQEQLYLDILKAYPQGVQDLSPLYAMTDAMTGSKFGATYKAPETFQDRAKLLAGLQDQTQNSRERLAQLLMNETGGIKQGTDEQTTKTGLEEDQKAGFIKPPPHAPSSGRMGNPANLAAKFMTTFDGSPVAKDAASGLIAANAVKSHLANPNWLGDSAARAAIIQAMHLAPVSNRDVEQITGSQDLFNKFDQLIKKLDKGDVFTASDRKTVERYADYLQKKSSMNLEGAADEYSRSHGPMYGYDYGTARGLLTPAMPKIQESAPKAPSLFDQLMQKELSK